MEDYGRAQRAVRGGTVVTSTRYVIFLSHVVEDFFERAGAAFPHVFETLTDAFVDVGCGGEVEEALVSGGVLDDGFGFAVDGEDDGALGGFELLHELDGVIAEGGEGLDVFGDVDHGWPS